MSPLQLPLGPETGRQLFVHLAHLAPRAFQIAVVGHDVVSQGDLSPEWKLRLDARVGFADRVPIACDEPQALDRFFGAHDDQDRKRLVRAGLYEKRGLVHDVRSGMVIVRLDVLCSGGSNTWVQDRIERFARFLVPKHQLADLLAVESAALVEHVFAELVDDRLQAGCAGLDHFAREIVRVDDRDTQIREHLCDGRLPARDPARKPNNRFHRVRVLAIASLGQEDLRCATRDRMRAVVQRVNEASVSVDDEIVGAIGRGLLVYLGAAEEDTDKDLRYMADKIAGLRVFANDEGKMSLSVSDIGGAVLVVSQFTLFGDVRRGRRPSFDGAAEPGEAERLYLRVVDVLREKGLQVETGTFRATMLVRSAVDGPVTIQIDSRKLY